MNPIKFITLLLACSLLVVSCKDAPATGDMSATVQNQSGYVMVNTIAAINGNEYFEDFGTLTNGQSSKIIFLDDETEAVISVLTFEYTFSNNSGPITFTTQMGVSMDFVPGGSVTVGIKSFETGDVFSDPLTFSFEINTG